MAVETQIGGVVGVYDAYQHGAMSGLCGSYL